MACDPKRSPRMPWRWRSCLSTEANAALGAGIPAVAPGCCAGEDMHAPTERIRTDSIAAGVAQLRAVLAEILA